MNTEPHDPQNKGGLKRLLAEALEAVRVLRPLDKDLWRALGLSVDRQASAAVDANNRPKRRLVHPEKTAFEKSRRKGDKKGNGADAGQVARLGDGGGKGQGQSDWPRQGKGKAKGSGGGRGA